VEFGAQAAEDTFSRASGKIIAKLFSWPPFGDRHVAAREKA